MVDSIKNFDENVSGDGVHIRCILRKLENAKFLNYHKYIDSIIQSKYHSQKSLEMELDDLKLSFLSKIKKLKNLKDILIKKFSPHFNFLCCKYSPLRIN